MKNPLFILFLIVTICLAGCQTESVYHNTPTNAKISTPAGIANYLNDLPSVKSATVWENEYAPGITINTDHYTIHTTLLDPLMLRQVPAFMESAYLEYQKQLPEPIDTQITFTMYLFDNRKQWEKFTKEFTGQMAPVYLKIKKGAYYLNGACVSYNIGRTRTFSVLGHEGWHQFNSRHFIYRLPSWLDEGIATLFETSTYTGSRFVFTPEKNLGRLGSLRKVILDDKMIPIEKLIELNPGEVVHYSDSDSVMAFYAQSYALVRFLREENYGQRLSDYHDLLLDALQGKWPLTPDQQQLAGNRNIPVSVQWNKYVSPKLFKHYIDKNPEILEQEFMAFCRKLVYNVRLTKSRVQ